MLSIKLLSTSDALDHENSQGSLRNYVYISIKFVFENWITQKYNFMSLIYNDTQEEDSSIANILISNTSSRPANSPDR